MTDIWTMLEERSRPWSALGRQGLADAVWADFVAVRFERSGDPRALQFLYPYLNHANRFTRLSALAVVAQVFWGRGARSLDALAYFTRHPDLFLRDRAPRLIGAALSGSNDEIILETLRPYLEHRNHFTLSQAVLALADAGEGRGSQRILDEIRRAGSLPGVSQGDFAEAVGRACLGRPDEERWALLAEMESTARIDLGAEQAISDLVRGAGDAWFERACREVFEPRLAFTGDLSWHQTQVRRLGLYALAQAGRGRGMQVLERVASLRNTGCWSAVAMNNLIEAFAGADPPAHTEPLLRWLREGDVPQQRIAALCLGRLAMGRDDDDAIEALVELTRARNGAVRSAALRGLGMAARSTCDDRLLRCCLELAALDETATAAVNALGMIYLGSGRAEVLRAICDLARGLRNRPVCGRHHSKPLRACYRAAGLVYLGTGDEAPVEFLLDVLSLPRTMSAHPYRWTAARALVMVDFSESALGWARIAENGPPIERYSPRILRMIGRDIATTV